MFSLPGPGELVVIAIVAVLLFGKRLPSVAYSIGNSFTQFKRGMTEVTHELKDVEDEVKQIGRDIKNGPTG